jgi:hypothetical protein
MHRTTMEKQKKKYLAVIHILTIAAMLSVVILSVTLLNVVVPSEKTVEIDKSTAV